MVDPADAERIVHRRRVADPQKIVRIPARGLAGQHKRFWRDDRAARRVEVIAAGSAANWV